MKRDDTGFKQAMLVAFQKLKRDEEFVCNYFYHIAKKYNVTNDACNTFASTMVTFGAVKDTGKKVVSGNGVMTILWKVVNVKRIKAYSVDKKARDRYLELEAIDNHLKQVAALKRLLAWMGVPQGR